MREDLLIDILQMTNTDGVGPVTFYKYLQKYGNTKDALAALKEKKTIISRYEAESIIYKANKLGAKIISYTDKEYPQNLLQLNDAPPLLYTMGNTSLLNYPVSIAIVGARNASIAGRKIASRIAYDLSQNDVLIISGMARGIDSAAHKGALYSKNQQGPTIAVLGTGPDIIYPTENKELYNNICQNGLVISEFPFGTTAQVSNFPRRNRIISALSLGVLIVEANLHSGSLITAKTALEQGKEIFAIPGSPLENRSKGPNMLIKEGAILTENSEDILNVLSIIKNQNIKKTKMITFPLDKEQNNVNISDNEIICSDCTRTESELISLISYEGVDIDELFRLSNLSQQDFFTQLLDLEFGGKIERQVGNKVAKIK